jgi:hypothetical protein
MEKQRAKLDGTLVRLSRQRCWKSEGKALELDGTAGGMTGEEWDCSTQLVSGGSAAAMERVRLPSVTVG